MVDWPHQRAARWRQHHREVACLGNCRSPEAAKGVPDVEVVGQVEELVPGRFDSDEQEVREEQAVVDMTWARDRQQTGGVRAKNRHGARGDRHAVAQRNEGKRCK